MDGNTRKEGCAQTKLRVPRKCVTWWLIRIGDVKELGELTIKTLLQDMLR